MQLEAGVPGGCPTLRLLLWPRGSVGTWWKCLMLTDERVDDVAGWAITKPV